MTTHKPKSQKSPSSKALVADSVSRDLKTKITDEIDEITQDSPKGKAMMALAPSMNNAAVIVSFQGNMMGEDVDLGTLVELLHMTAKEVTKGDLTEFESMLVGQAKALQTLFASLARTAAAQKGTVHFEKTMRLALKTQAQCLAVITKLDEMKRHRTTSYFGQTNVETGLQQINTVIQTALQAVLPQILPSQESDNKKVLGQGMGSESINCHTTRQARHYLPKTSRNSLKVNI